MANDRQSVFNPVDPASFEGPFSGSLRPPEPNRTAGPSQVPPGISSGGGIAMAASAFLESATKGRIKAYENRENEKLKKLTQLNQYMSQVYPTLTPEGQQQAMQMYSRAIGPEVLNAMGNGKKGKGGVSKDEMPSRDGQQTQGNASTTGDVHRHFTGILKDVALGMAGGKMPKGAPDVDLHSVIGNIALLTQDPKLNREGVINSNVGNIQGALKDYEGPREGALAKIAPHLEAIGRLDPARANAASEYYLGQYQPAPRLGSPEERELRASRVVPRGPAAPPEPVANATMVAGYSPAQRPGPPAGVSRLTGRTLDGDQMWALRERTRPGEDWQVPGSPGTRLRGSIIDLSTGPAFFDQSGREMNVDVSQLVPWSGLVRKNIVNPNDSTDVRSVSETKEGIRLDEDGIPLAKADARNSWQEGTGYYRPAPDKKIGVSGGHVLMLRADGSTYATKATVDQRPDHWMQRFKFEEGKEIRSATRQSEAQYTAEKSRIKRAWQNRIASIDKDFPILKPKEREAKKAEFEKQQQVELSGLESDHSDMLDALGDIYGGDSAPPDAAKKKDGAANRGKPGAHSGTWGF